MLAIPGRAQFAALTEATRAIGPIVTLGFARAQDEGRVSVLYSYPFGLGQYVLAAADVPAILQPAENGTRESDAAALKANPHRAIEWLLLFGGVERVVATRICGLEAATCFWVGFSDPNGLTADQRVSFETVATRAAEFLRSPVSADAETDQLKRLERTAELL